MLKYFTKNTDAKKKKRSTVGTGTLAKEKVPPKLDKILVGQFGLLGVVLVGVLHHHRGDEQLVDDCPQVGERDWHTYT